MILTLLNTLTADGDDELDFTSGIDSTYDEYMFVFTDINPATDQQNFEFQVNATDASGYNENITSTFIRQYMQSSNNDANGPDYNAGSDQDNDDAAFQNLNETGQLGSDADECLAGIMHLFSPASTTYVKHFYATTNESRYSAGLSNAYISGYINDTTAIDDVRFKMSSGAFDGVIQMYGVA